jgi:periplasmic mercuric ion binding protein
MTILCISLISNFKLSFMKTIKILLVTAVCFAVVTTSYAQKTRTESFNVSGECGTCKKKIESSARAAGATYAFWDQHTKILKVSYNAGTDVSAIQKSIADAGYDTPKFRAPDEAYNSLDKCCQYERQDVKKVADCCANPDCKMKDGKCADMAVCKDNSCCKNNEDCVKKSCC